MYHKFAIFIPLLKRGRLGFKCYGELVDGLFEKKKITGCLPIKHYCCSIGREGENRFFVVVEDP
jgi:hypothetical protein